MDKPTIANVKAIIPSEYLENLIYLAYGGPKGIFAAIGESDLLEGLVQLSTNPEYSNWQVDVIIDPNQDLPGDIKSELVPLLSVIIKENVVFVFQNGPDFSGPEIKRPSAYDPLTAPILNRYAIDMLQLNH
jgi:hypothetical protein